MEFLQKVKELEGFLQDDEVEMLYRLVVNQNIGEVIELGSYRGKSTAALALAAKERNIQIWSIDPHDDFKDRNEVHYGKEDRAAKIKQLQKVGCLDHVRFIDMYSGPAAKAWNARLLPKQQVGLLWIDINHEFEPTWQALKEWSEFVTIGGYIAMHDIYHFEGPKRAMNKFLVENKCMAKRPGCRNLGVMQKVLAHHVADNPRP